MGLFLVTGGAGFIGSNLVEELLRRGARVRVVDNFVTGREENLEGLPGEIDLIRGDLRDPEVCARAVKGVEKVFHQAALGSVPRSVDDPLTTHESNVTATVNLLIAAREAGVKRFACASSSSVYGMNPAIPKKEDMTTMPMSPYAVSKLAQETYCLAFHAVYGMETVALRYFNIYGPRQDPASTYAAVIPRFVSAALEGKSPEIYGDGEQSRDFTFVGDCVEANIRAGESDKAVGRAVNVACGGETSVNRLWELIRGIIGADVEAVHKPERKGDVRRSRADVSLARELLDWSPQTSLEQGLETTVAWMRPS